MEIPELQAASNQRAEETVSETAATTRLPAIVWAIAGVAFATFLIRVVFFVDALALIVFPSARVTDLVISFAEVGVVAFAAIGATGIARRHAAIPATTWYAIALVPLVMWGFAVRDAAAGSYSLAFLAGVLTLGLALAALWDWRARVAAATCGAASVA